MCGFQVFVLLIKTCRAPSYSFNAQDSLVAFCSLEVRDSFWNSVWLKLTLVFLPVCLRKPDWQSRSHVQSKHVSFRAAHTSVPFVLLLPSGGSIRECSDGRKWSHPVVLCSKYMLFGFLADIQLTLVFLPVRPPSRHNDKVVAAPGLLP